MKGLIFYVRNNDFAPLLQILYQNNVEGVSYCDFGGRGKLKRSEIPKNIDDIKHTEQKKNLFLNSKLEKELK